MRPEKTAQGESIAFACRREPALRRERLNAGQGLIEYAMIIVLIAVVVMIVLQALGPAIGNIYSSIVASI
jgi:pilus assembly protein Flp/PilA